MASWKTSRLMSFDAVSSHICCHFNEVLVGLMREVRQLQGLGYRMKQQLSNEVDIAARFYRWGGSAARSSCCVWCCCCCQPALRLA
jgi:dynein heavy chain 2